MPNRVHSVVGGPASRARKRRHLVRHIRQNRRSERSDCRKSAAYNENAGGFDLACGLPKNASERGVTERGT
jgi:hypothetical protein